MPHRPDDFKVGQWIAVTDVYEKMVQRFDEWGYSYRTVFDRMNQYAPVPVNGQPLKIVAINLPFIAVSDGTHRFPLDVRSANFVKLDSKYVKAMEDAVIQDGNDTSFSIAAAEEGADDVLVVDDGSPIRPNRFRPSAPCPVCGGKLIVTGRLGSPESYECRSCGFSGGRGSDSEELC